MIYFVLKFSAVCFITLFLFFFFLKNVIFFCLSLSKSGLKKEWCFTCEFESLILKAKEGNSPLSPLGILSQIRNIGSHLGNGKEEDAHEFLR